MKKTELYLAKEPLIRWKCSFRRWSGHHICFVLLPLQALDYSDDEEEHDAKKKKRQGSKKKNENGGLAHTYPQLKDLPDVAISAN